MSNIPWLAMLIGVISTFQLHLAKAMQKHGITIFQKSNRTEGQEEKSDKSYSKLKKPTIYIIGIILNYSVFIWASLATSYGLASHYTSMFGLGLIILLLYANFILKERITPMELIGTGILICGTLLLGFENTNQSTIDRNTINYTSAFVFFLIYVVVSSVILGIMVKIELKFLSSIILGLIAGTYGCLDPIFKELGLTYGQSEGLLPIHIIGWFFYIVSFIIGFVAFLITQLGFSKTAEASVLVPVYNSVYVTFPILFQIISFSNYIPNIFTILGIIICVSGIFLMQIYKKRNIDANLPINQESNPKR